MRHAIFSDVHAHPAALRAVLTDAADAGATHFICLGDTLGYGPEPVAALELVHARAHICLAGNHDDAVCGRMTTEDFNEYAAEAVARHRAALSPSALNWLRTLPYMCEQPGFACAHGDFSAPAAFNYILKPEEAMPSWDVRPEPLLFVGHTHRPGIFVKGGHGIPHALEPMDFALEEGKRYIVNVGSVGYPRSGACRSFYCIYDDVSRTVFFRSLPFDLDAYLVQMAIRGLDEAPWMTARARARQIPQVRNGDDFAAPEPAPENAPITYEDRLFSDASPKSHGVWYWILAVVFGALAAVSAGAVVFSLVKIAQLPPVKMPVLSEKPAPAADQAELGIVVCTRRCTVPAGGRVSYGVNLARKSPPAHVRLRFADATGAIIKGEGRSREVKRTFRSHAGGYAVPAQATQAILEVSYQNGKRPCVVDDCYLKPYVSKEIR